MMIRETVFGFKLEKAAEKLTADGGMAFLIFRIMTKAFISGNNQV